MIVNCCRDFVGFLESHLSGELPLPAKVTFYLHLAVCRNCRKYLRSYKETVKMGKIALAPTDDPIPNEVPEELVRAVMAACRKMPAPPDRVGPPP